MGGHSRCNHGTHKLLSTSFRPWIIDRSGLTALAALLSCFAIVLNVAPFARSAKQEPVRADKSARTSSIAPSRNAPAVQPPPVRSDVGTANASQVIEPSTELSFIIDDELARLGIPSVRPPGRVGEMQAAPAPQDGGAPVTPPLATIVGIWVPDATACSARSFREGFLPTIINADGAWAGETFCMFRNQKQIDTGWKVVASCSNPNEHWTTEVRLTVKDNRLTWTSKRGTQVYTRCAPDFLVAATRE
jgi:hypothetical protein